MLTNIQVAGLIYELATMKELDGANFYQVQAHLNAARFLENFKGPLDSTDFQQFHGIGEKLNSKIHEAAKTGSIKELEMFRIQYPNLEDLKIIHGIGPKKALKIYKNYGVRTRQELKTLFDARKIVDEKLRIALEMSLIAPPSYARTVIQERIEPLLNALRGAAERVAVVGSMRRLQERIHDVDILVAGSNRVRIWEEFHKFGPIINNGEKKTAIWLYGSLPVQIDLLMVDIESWGSALCYFTGNKDHNVRLRILAREKGLLVNEYGIYKDGVKMGGEKEEDLYNILGIPFIEPEFRKG